MGRNRTTIDFNVDAFRKHVKDQSTFTERASKLGVSKQNINGWLNQGRIPPRALAEIAMDLKLSAENMAEILAVETNHASKTREKRIIYSIEIYEHFYDEEGV